MIITNVESIAFKVKSDWGNKPSRWGYGIRDGSKVDVDYRILRITTDDGTEGYHVGGAGHYWSAPP